ncbi:hypothetical protein [Rhodoferax bucti]|uniref:hypothetical protein n=1 Tax=Rhodoferax bucti TaxID=2576305 RepID=UPI001109459B|nr:hypothetical protein [Rhodoferax bucti]
MQIHQFQVSYLAEQDRILVRMNSTNGQEQRLWLTRRMLLGLYPHLEQTSAQLTIADASPVGHDGAAGDAVQAFQRQETLDRTDFDTPFQSPQPLFTDADQPLLVTAAHIQQQGASMLSVRFEETLPGMPESRQLEINLGSDTLVALLHVISLALQNSDWGLHTAAARPPTPPQTIVIETDAQDSEWDAFAAAEPPKYLN